MRNQTQAKKAIQKNIREILNNPEFLTFYVKSGEGVGASILARDVYEYLLAPQGC